MATLRVFKVSIRDTIPAWACIAAERESLLDCARAMRGPDSHMYSAVASIEFEKGFDVPGKLKTAEYMELAGPFSKYLLEVSLRQHSRQWSSSIWTFSATCERGNHAATALEIQMPKLLAALERLLPARELDINRRMMLHLVETIKERGPCWASSM